MVARNESLVVFADIDGILFSRGLSSFEESATALELLSQRDIPLVLCSGKTRAQLESVQQQLGIRHPFVCEHGAAVFIPHGYFSHEPRGRSIAGYHVVEFGPPHRDVLERFHLTAVRARVDVLGFSQLTIEDVASQCGLSLMEARLAKLREYDEPFRLQHGDSRERDRLFRALRDAHLGCRRGQHFDHVGAVVDSDVAVHLLSTLYRNAYGDVSTVGFGVTSGHAALLGVVDRAFVLPDDDGRQLRELQARVPRARTVEKPGPAGWADTIFALVGPDRRRRDSRRVARASITR